MRLRLRRPAAKSRALLLLALSACTAQSATIPSSTATKAQARAAARSSGVRSFTYAQCNAASRLLYVTHAGSNSLDVYKNPQAPLPIGPLLSVGASAGLNQPMGVYAQTASTGVIAVANYGAQTVLLFKRCPTAAGATLTDAPYSPIDVAIVGSTVYVSNQTPPSVTIFPNLSNPYTTVLTDPNAANGGGVTVDNLGNCFWSFGDSSNNGYVDEFPGCTMPGFTLPLKVALNYPNTIRMWETGTAHRLIFEDAVTGMVYSFTGPTYNAQSAGSPFALTGTPAATMALRNNKLRLYVGDASGAVQRHVYPSNSPTLTWLSVAPAVTGVGVWPPPP